MKKHKLWIFASLTLALAAAPFAGMLLQGNGIVQTKQSAAASFVHELNHPEEEALPAFSTTPIKLGSSGQDVYELQGRLKHLGFYEGKIDSQFGPKTKNSVTWFQWKFGMKSDGIVGAKTKLKLYNATKNWKPTESASATGNNTANNNNLTKQIQPIIRIQRLCLQGIRWDYQKMISKLWLMPSMVSQEVNLSKDKLLLLQ